MAREDSERGRGRGRDDDEDDRGRGSRGGREDTKGRSGGVSLDDDDAIDVGLFSSGPATITESLFAPYDYQGTASRNPPIVWLITLQRGSGKEKETYEQPYTIGKGWDLDKRSGALIAKNGQTGLPKSCNATLYLIKPLKKALAKAGIDLPTKNGIGGDPRVLEGLEVIVERIDQEERNIKERGGRDRDRDRDRDRGRDREEKGPPTILVVDKVESAPWDKGGKSRSKSDAEDDDQPRRGRGKNDDDDEKNDKEERGRGGKNGSKDDGDADLKADAIEALVKVVEKGKCKTGEDLEERLEKVLKGVKNSGAIIDFATSPKFLATEKGWTFDEKRKTIDASE